MDRRPRTAGVHQRHVDDARVVVARVLPANGNKHRVDKRPSSFTGTRPSGGSAIRSSRREGMVFSLGPTTLIGAQILTTFNEAVEIRRLFIFIAGLRMIYFYLS